MDPFYFFNALNQVPCYCSYLGECSNAVFGGRWWLNFTSGVNCSLNCHFSIKYYIMSVVTIFSNEYFLHTRRPLHSDLNVFCTFFICSLVMNNLWSSSFVSFAVSCFVLGLLRQVCDETHLNTNIWYLKQWPDSEKFHQKKEIKRLRNHFYLDRLYWQSKKERCKKQRHISKNSPIQVRKQSFKCTSDWGQVWMRVLCAFLYSS